jgi:ribose/xylose/arabinose/galactoside ABC-type transport system permease subunit
MNVSSGYYLVLTGMILIVIVAFERIKGLKREGTK